MTESKLTSKQCVAYASGLFGQNALLVVMGFLMVYYTDAIGISAAAAGTVILVGKIWDAVTDPIMGLIVDRTKTRWGKFRPYMLFSPLVLIAAGIFCFSIPAQAAAALKIVLVYLSNILFWTVFTALDVSYWAIIPAITKTADERNRINAFANYGIMPGAMLASIFAVPLIAAFGGGTSNAAGYVPTVVIFLVLTVAGTLFAFASLREKYAIYNDESGKGRFLESFSVIFKNKPLILLITGILFYMLANAFKMSGMIYYVKYVIGDEGLYALINVAMMLATLIVLAFVPRIIKAIGKKSAFIVSMLIAAASNILIYFFGGVPALLIAFSAFGGVAFALYGVSYASMLADTVEYAQWKTGRRSEGVIYSSRTFITKVGSAVGAGVIGLVLGLAHYDGMAAQQTAEAVSAIRIVNTLVPAALMMLAALPMLRYDLTEEKYTQIVAELDQRNA